MKYNTDEVIKKYQKKFPDRSLESIIRLIAVADKRRELRKIATAKRKAKK